MNRLFFIIAALLLLTTTADAGVRYAICPTTCTWDASNTGMWAGSSGGATGAPVPVGVDGAIFDSNTCVGGTTCTITVNTNPTVDFLEFDTCTGSTTGCILDFSANNNNITINSQYLGNGGGLRTLKMGNGTWTIVAGSGIVWDSSATTNFTQVSGNSTITVGAGINNGPTFSMGLGIIYNTIQATGVVKFISGVGTIQVNNLTIVAPAYIIYQDGVTLQVNTAFTVSGSSSTNQVGFAATGIGAAATILKLPSSSTMSWVSLRDISFAGSGSTPTATNSFNLGHNVNVTITPPGGGGTTACILGGWLLWRDMPDNLNDNFPAWLEKAA